MYTQAEFDAFGWNPVMGLPLSETHGLDYESAREATPKWYGVSWGNGNDGVSHMWPDYYVRTDDPWKLAEIAAVSNLKDRTWAKENVEIDGEADYTITAMFLDPPDDDADDSWYIATAYENGAVLIEDDEDGGNDGWRYLVDGEDASPVYETEAEAARAFCGSNGIEPGSWSESNGAWLLCEVFPVDMDEERSSAPRYDSLADCFTVEDMKGIE